MGHTTADQQPTTRTWDSLTYGEAHAMRYFLDHDHDLGHEARRIAGDDHDLALWLVDAGNAFADGTKTFPDDLNHSCWREWRAAGLSPQVAAQVALHLKPIARIVDERLICPVCGTADRIAERDVAVRHNQLYVSEGCIYAATESCDYEHDRFVCQHCGIDVRLPSRVEDWS
ncbi:hypothetical protein [Actinokineospora cianjurensis]|uniref:Uncharacterized protein n=1 Tax=Actinokineospora cianjurensis TaxID=585224 RepID=A0A421AX65_9PSEU|nr:hypothetical protein [Actinokineospora cianjurensis]RLK54437.1 hypothetical protein CLV68_5987 [Actinokineospora cianjurensis]